MLLVTSNKKLPANAPLHDFPLQKRGAKAWEHSPAWQHGAPHRERQELVFADEEVALLASVVEAATENLLQWAQAPAHWWDECQSPRGGSFFGFLRAGLNCMP